MSNTATGYAQRPPSREVPPTSPTRVSGIFYSFIDETAYEGAEHAAGESHKAAEPEQISDERCRKGDAETVPRTEKYGAENVYHMLYRRTLTAEHRERE